MAFVLPAIQTVGSFVLSNAMAIMSGVGAIGSAVSAYQTGRVQQAMLNQQAEDLRTQAGQERAASHARMARMRQEAKSRASETQVALATKGFDALDVSSLQIIGATAAEESLQEQLEKAQGEQRALNMINQAKQKRWEGRQARKAAGIQAVSGLATSGAGWWDRYGAGVTRGFAGGTG